MIYHRVLAAPDNLQPDLLDTAAFDAEIRLIDSIFHIMPLAQALENLKAGCLSARSACITFDDGYADNLIHALPILQKYRMHATFFVATDYLDGGRMFNDTVIEAVRLAPAGKHDLRKFGLGCYALVSMDDRINAIRDMLSKVKYLPWSERSQRVAEIGRQLTDQPLPNDLMLTTEQLCVLHAAGMEIGAHTASHPILACVPDAAARDDILRGRQCLERLLNTEIRLFAYPNGRPGTDYLSVHASMVRELGFAGAVSTASGVAEYGTDSYQLPRFSPWSRNRTRAGLLLLRNLAQRHPQPALCSG
ncbi:polysaccharide deacetylase family protein [Allochromatium vinosum]|uniref:polysaccharide deacetylase family protein n=1 Tax=Allochromatium vinosum TaxID=1049 RepID=UPI001F5BBAAF|nr:polysaccharide deacetylase family protein [Allochromatium vinosum]